MAHSVPCRRSKVGAAIALCAAMLVAGCAGDSTPIGGNSAAARTPADDAANRDRCMWSAPRDCGPQF